MDFLFDIPKNKMENSAVFVVVEKLFPEVHSILIKSSQIVARELAKILHRKV